MTRRGRKRRLVLEDEYWKLILDGVPTVEACRQLGIGRKTGYRWRTEAGGIPPARVAEEARSSRYLSLLERQRIATLRERGLGVREIGRRIGRSPSTVSRELRRNMKPHDKKVYDADLAHARARDKARRERAGVLVRDAELRDMVQAKLEDTWSPQQIRPLRPASSRIVATDLGKLCEVTPREQVPAAALPSLVMRPPPDLTCRPDAIPTRPPPVAVVRRAGRHRVRPVPRLAVASGPVLLAGPSCGGPGTRRGR